MGIMENTITTRQDHYRGEIMDFIRLSADSERLLLKLTQSDNPVRMLSARFEQTSQQKNAELRSMLKELHERGYIDVQWADNIPYYLTINNSAKIYKEQLAEHEAQKTVSPSQEKEMSPVIFISHRSTDKAIAEMLLDFFSGTGIPRENVFCSSLPGNDIKEKISEEVKTALKKSAVNIAVLSTDYYQSAYCLNEAGILWYRDDVPVIPIALPEIDSSNMYGFLNNEYKLRRLDSTMDISHIYDVVREAVSAPQVKSECIAHESEKFKTKYSKFLSTRDLQKNCSTLPASTSLSESMTDDERIVLYYICQKKVRRVSKEAILNWLHTKEIYGVNIDNAFDLLSSTESNSVINGTLELGVDVFRRYSSNSALFLGELEECVNRHKKLAADTFNVLWEKNELDTLTKLFFAYIIDEKMCSFGDRWMEKEQIKNIKQWEIRYSLEFTLSNNYQNCLQFLIRHNLVYESDWTCYGNPREYTLCPSLQELLFRQSNEINKKLQNIKRDFRGMIDESIPF